MDAIPLLLRDASAPAAFVGWLIVSWWRNHTASRQVKVNEQNANNEQNKLQVAATTAALNSVNMLSKRLDDAEAQKAREREEHAKEREEWHKERDALDKCITDMRHEFNVVTERQGQEIATLRARVKTVEEENARLTNENATLKQENAQLRTDLDEIKKSATNAQPITSEISPANGEGKETK